MNMSEEAERALLAAPGYAQGTPVKFISPEVRTELTEAKLIGPLGGLTRKGSIRAERLKSAQERELFA